MLLLGYQHSAFYHFGIPHIPATLPVGGVLVTTLLGPYPLPLVSKRWSWYGGVGGTIARLTDIAMRADTVAVQFSTERTLAPEAVFMLMYNVAPSYRVFLGTSYQYLRFGSVTYRAVESGQHIPAAALQRLPESMELQSLHFSLGFSFSASGLMLGR